MSESKSKIVSSYIEFYEGFQEKSLTFDQMFNDQSSGLWQPETNTFLDFYTLKSLFFSEDWVYILVDRVASKISSQYLRVMHDEIVNGKKISKPAEGHPAQKVLDQPNEVQDYHTWMYGLVADDCLLGNSFNWFSKSLGQIIPIPGENCRPFFNGKGDLEKYVITQSTSEGQKPLSWSLSIDEICHIRRPNPSSLYVGLSPFIAAQKSVLFSRYSAEYLNNFYIKGAQPGLVLEMSQETNQEMALRLLRSMEGAYTGRRNQWRPVVLPRGIKASQMAVSIADQQLIDLVNQNREKIINILQVPKHELSLAEAGSLGSEEYKTAIKNFWRGPLRSTMRRIAGALTLKMKDMLGDGYYLEFDLSDIEYLSEDEGIKADTAAKMLAVHTLNEVRAKVYDLPPLPDGDRAPGTQVAVPFSQFQMPSNVEQATNEPDITVQELPEMDNTKAIQRAEMFKKSNGGKWWEDRLAEEQRAIDPAQEKMAILVSTILRAQANLAAKAFLSSEKSYRKKEDKDALRRRIRKAIDKLEDDYISGYTGALAGVVEAGYSSALKLPFELPNQDALQAIRERNASRRSSLLEARGIDHFALINEKTTDDIIDIIGDAMERSLQPKDIADLIKEYFKSDNQLYRATRIARTETLTASSVGQAAAMKDAEKAIGEKLKKMWLTVGDNRVRDEHVKVEGEIVESDEKFSNGLMYPRQPGGEPENVINCRCSWVMVPVSEADSLDQWKDELNIKGV
jgi:HK97 family phage portal protein